jgi:hypothetical protein
VVAAVFEARMTRGQAETLAMLMREGRTTRPGGVLTASLLYENDVASLIAVWRSRDMLDRYLSITAVPRGTELMRAVGVEPSFRVVETLECG